MVDPNYENHLTTSQSPVKFNDIELEIMEFRNGEKSDELVGNFIEGTLETINGNENNLLVSNSSI